MPKWLLYTLLTILFWGLWGVGSKAMSSSLSAWQLQAMSTSGMLPVLGALWWMSEKKGGPSSRRGTIEAFAAGLLGCAGNMACFQAMSVGGKAAAVIPLTSLYPITTIALAMVFLSERLNRIQTLGIGFSLLAIWLFNVPDPTGLQTIWLAFSLLPIALWGVGGFLQKLATFHISGERCALAFLLAFLPLSVVVVLEEPGSTPVSTATFLLSALVGLLFALGNLTVILAYGSGGKAAIVTPAAGLYSLVTVPLAVAVLGESISWRDGWGIAAALLAVIALCYEGPANPSSAPN